MNAVPKSQTPRLRRRIACCLALLVAGGIAHTQQDVRLGLPARLDNVVQAYVQTSGFMGSMLVAHGNRILLDKGYGSANLEWNIPNAPDVRFRLGSLTKQFTAALIMQLQDKGQLQIDEPVSKYLPNVPESWRAITVKELLNMTSGIPNFISLQGYREWSMEPHTPDEIVAFFKNQPLGFAPGTRFEYSNSNYIVLGEIIERLTGKSYAECLKDNIFIPLGMVNSGLGNDDAIVSRSAEGYLPAMNDYARARSQSLSVAWSVGGIYSTTGDLLKWERGLFGGKVLSAASLAAMTARSTGENWVYGLGLMIHDKDEFAVFDHGGSIEGFNTHLSYVPKLGITVIVLGNVDAFVTDQMADQILNEILNKPVSLPSVPKAGQLPDEELQKYIGVYALPPLEGPNFTSTISLNGRSLTAKLTGRAPTPLIYEGMKGGHPWFFSPRELAEIEFIPDARGVMASIVYHLAGEEFPGSRK